MNGKSFRDALTEAKTTDGQATIYYAGEDRTHAVYGVVDYETGEMYINGRILTISDMPEDAPVLEGVTPDTYVFAKTIHTAEIIFSHNHVDIQSGWNTKPEELQ